MRLLTVEWVARGKASFIVADPVSKALCKDCVLCEWLHFEINRENPRFSLILFFLNIICFYFHI